jgi:rhodanese-related sulfurtransferase
MRVLGLTIVSTWLAASCSSAKKIDVGGTCVLNSDCNQGLVCTWGKCHVACNTSADCPTGQSCVTSSDQSNVCQLLGETYCIYNHDCPTGLICGVDQKCRKQCQVDIDCLYGQICTNAQTCVEPNQVDSNTVADGGVSATGGADAASFEAAKPDAVTIDMAATDLAPAALGEISPQQLHAALASKDFLLIDVHTPNAGSIPGTDARIAYTDISALVAFIGPNLDTKVVLTCLMGGMSKSAGNALVALGYRNISELTGGMSAWTTAGYSLVHLDGGL